MRYYSWIFLLLVLMGCSKEKGYKTYSGESQGTTFLIKYESSNGKEYDAEIDSILEDVDFMFSTYIDESIISRFNESESGVEINEVFADLWEKCWELNIESDGYFDPTLSPVFEAYKKMGSDVLDSNMILQALSHTGMPLVSKDGLTLRKKDGNLKLDFNAVAQGYSVDMISDYFLEKGIKNYMVEIGGEVYAYGVNDKRKHWTIGIDKPINSHRALISSIALDNKALATSGNYRKFKEIEGKKMGHIINPKTGFPGYTNILSVSVIADKCYRADALATALMNQSSEEIKEFDGNTNDIQIVLIELLDGDTAIYASPGLKLKPIH